MTANTVSDAPHVIAALAASDSVEAVILARDVDAFAALHAPELIVNSPANRVIDGATAARAMVAGMIDYSRFERHVEHASRLPNNTVVIMGEELLVLRGVAPNAGKTVADALPISGARTPIGGCSRCSGHHCRSRLT